MKFYLIFSITFSTVIIFTTANNEPASPGFFLKVTKNVPRLGRRSGGKANDFENYFLKVSKSVPRIGRRDPINQMENSNEHPLEISKRVQGNPKSNFLYDFNRIQPLDTNKIFEMISKSMISSDDFKFISWKDLDSALERDDDLYVKLMSIARDAEFEYNKLVPLYDDENAENSYYQTYSNGNDDHKERLQYQF